MGTKFINFTDLGKQLLAAGHGCAVNFGHPFYGTTNAGMEATDGNITVIS